jgi:acetoin utilization deacetylase AcuC-like enzyme
MTKNLQIAYTDDYLNWKLGAGDNSHPTKPIRAKLATESLLELLGSDVTIISPDTMEEEDRALVESIHSPDYVAEVLDEYLSHDWVGRSPSNAETALTMFAGTVRLVENMLAGEVDVAFNPQGAKHHAKYSHSEGFCVFNDFAWAAREFKEAGMKPLYIDWDVHAGNGVQSLLADTDIPTLSIHGSGIYPVGDNNHSFDKELFGKAHTWHNEDEHWYNWNLALGSSDEELSEALDEVEDVVRMYEPDVILLAAGADGHEGEYWGMEYTYEGFIESARRVASLANEFTLGRVLIGGAGGYQAQTWTPAIWAGVVSTIYKETR